VDSRRAFEHAAWLTRTAPFRQSSTDRERRAAPYLPGLRAAEELPRLAGERYHLVLTRLLRERNRVRYALREACRLIETCGAV
jgi:hypothetical protein